METWMDTADGGAKTGAPLVDRAHCDPPAFTRMIDTQSLTAARNIEDTETRSE